MKQNADEKTLEEIRLLLPDLNVLVDKLGVVLENLARKLDADGPGVEPFLLQDVAAARSTLRYLIELVDVEKRSWNLWKKFISSIF